MPTNIRILPRIRRRGSASDNPPDSSRSPVTPASWRHSHAVDPLEILPENEPQEASTSSSSSSAFLKPKKRASPLVVRIPQPTFASTKSHFHTSPAVRKPSVVFQQQ